MKGCPACGSINYRVVENYNSYLILLCRSCRLFFTDPMLSGDLQFYQKNIVYQRVDSITIAQHCRSAASAANLKLLSMIPKASRILDIGCGFGAFVHFSRNQGYDAYGIDFNEQQIQAGRTFLNLGDKLMVRDIRGFRAKNLGLESFSLITLFEVIEHVENPSELIRELHTILCPEGIMAISCPNEARWMLTGRVFVDFPPHHLTRWRPETLKRFLENRGFQHLETKVDSMFSDWLWVAYVNYSAKRKYANKLKMTGSCLERDTRPAHSSNFKMSIFNFIKLSCLPLDLILKLAGIGTLGMRMIVKRL